MKSNISCPDIRREAGPPEPLPPSMGIEIKNLSSHEGKTHLIGLSI